ncbi:unnamed protein product [Calypogeia fissa]
MAHAPERVLQTQLRATILMEFIIDKLNLLNYGQDFCSLRNPPWGRLHKLYFVLPSNNHNEQFLYFSSLVAWLLYLIGQHFAAPKESDDPNAICANIMVELKNLGFAYPSWPPTILKQGYGDAVCTVLDGLTSLRLEISKFSFQPPIHQIDFNQVESPLVTGDFVGINNELFVSEVDDEEDAHVDVTRREVNSRKSDDKTRVVSCKVDPQKWKLELDRVAPQLQVSVVVDAKDWRAHLEQALKQHNELLNKLTSSSAQLERLENEVASTLEIVESREKFINLQFEPLVSEYATLKEKLGELQEDHKLSLDNVATLTDEISQVSDQIEHVKQLMVEKGNEISDVSPLIQIKAAIQKLKKENQDMEVCIGVLENSFIKVGLKQVREGGSGPFLHL